MDCVCLLFTYPAADHPTCSEVSFRENLHCVGRGDDLVKYVCILWIWIYIPGKGDAQSLDAARDAGVAIAEHSHTCHEFSNSSFAFSNRIHEIRVVILSSYAAKYKNTSCGLDYASPMLDFDVPFFDVKDF